MKNAGLILALVSSSMLATFSMAQEGHPYDGTWRGQLTRNDDSIPVVVIMDYDGENITGMINPGRNSYRFDSAEHDAPNWRLSVATQTRQGEAVSFTAVMKEPGARNRYMEGTWTQAGVDYQFRIIRE